MTSLYYTAPKDSIFEEVRSAYILIRLQGMIDDDGYNLFQSQKDKIEWAKKLENIEDNIMSFVGKLDIINQIRLSRLISKETRKAIYDRLIDGGALQEAEIFNL